MNRFKKLLKKALYGTLLGIVVFQMSLFAGCTGTVSPENPEEPDIPPVTIETPVPEINYFVNSVNHRGDYNAPENTLSAYRKSAENGFTMVECDVSFTKDGYAVLLHDDTVDRTSNGSGRIDSLTLEEVRALDFGSWKSVEYAGEKIPTFEEFILLCRNLSLHPYIELKSGATAEQAKQVVQTVIRYGMRGKVSFLSFEADLLKAVTEVDPEARIGYVVSVVTIKNILSAMELRTGKNEVFIDSYYLSAQPSAVAMCMEQFLPLEVWTVDTESDILALDPYVSGVTSNTLIAGKVLAENEA